MKLFKVESENVSYDEDVSMVIVAEDSEEALQMAKIAWQFREGHCHDKFIVKEININQKQIVDTSHYGD